mgnify:CR=1 FL=1
MAPFKSVRRSITVGNIAVYVMPPNPDRLGATIYSDGNGDCFIALGDGISLTDFTLRMSGNDYIEIPFGYTGVVTAIRKSGSCVLRVSELT